MKANTRHRIKVIEARVVSIVDLPFYVVALPHIWLVRRISKIMNEVMRLEFVRKGMCGGCSKFGTRRCKKHVMNPYAVLERGCLAAD